ncbi:winged helix-turn-helix transcriptional regulator [Kordiimonas sp. SCSIO 12603]|uniref:MarR family winged helix-turn-helix transcriptional regulator n=1 Tax=Kordiimonas sp. SCSIO 12603 TaxID=2829596 RepID=UPI002104382D|nr:MarR family winged helix-turn-helix transcriptional regulator [Kordiimonas sp. SCSIO 12603]UTW57133.1 winged helix-turn-helix transcriptional regulator [Kordiimonas sp. SCSIO 12603]
MNEKRLENFLEALALKLKMADKPIANAHGLQHIHMQIISYLGRCNRYSDTFLMLCEYLGQTRGTVSKSVDKLQDKGLLEKITDPDDKRKSHLRLTDKGISIKKEQQTLWSSLNAALPADQQLEINESLQTLLKQFQKLNENKSFGTCPSCRYFKTGPKGGICTLTGEPLLSTELELICAHHKDGN